MTAKSCEICGSPVRAKRFCSPEHWHQWLRENVKPAPGAALRKRAYVRWTGMLQRCENQAHPQWPDYGGRGIYVCERWHDFDLYYADTGDAPDGRSLDRVDNDGPYAPDNIRWATPKEQRANQRPMRRKTHCKNGHLFDEANTSVNRHGWRTCRKCRSAYKAQRKAAQRVGGAA